MSNYNEEKVNEFLDELLVIMRERDKLNKEQQEVREILIEQLPLLEAEENPDKETLYLITSIKKTLEDEQLSQ